MGRGHGRELGAIAAANDCADKHWQCSESWVDDNKCNSDQYWKGQCPKKCKTCQATATAATTSDGRRRKGETLNSLISESQETTAVFYVENQPHDSPIRSYTSKCVGF